MGARIFQTQAEGTSVQNAFDNAFHEAKHQHGHGGYTGTIAEKDLFREFKVPRNLTAEEVFDMLSESNYRPTESLTKHFGEDEAYRLFGTFDEKWGPAVALQVRDGVWMFCGWASC